MIIKFSFNYCKVFIIYITFGEIEKNNHHYVMLTFKMVYTEIHVSPT